MTKEQLIQIAKVAFPERVQHSINFDNTEMLHQSGVYRLYDKDEDFVMLSPKSSYLSVFIGEDKFVQFEVGHKAFNHYAAIKEMEKMKLV
ncbi:hypothetical protein [Pontibacter beigongshangensis]|uniref:hypothetical protein n=1 Tax=Pontibacter beigongshangensis TaxID=2574733 RepID=UPI001650A018|nr:hypothetical protein [Pontibacter beigongshangensis]